ncbi:hypothetical protein Goarm_018544 [Gossypium armourianum]|uniref:Thioredoxin domain-containing protein n=1 Tax=Gossypium armourianum TaxID=34283 RepID=A0A7J9IJB9_9ROSI|nr:hypothetical protein [Gossypium armourianum]
MKNDCRFALLLLFLTSITLHTKAEVITLTPDTFSDKVTLLPSLYPPFNVPNLNQTSSLFRVKEKDTAWFVKFCVPWCKHCKNLGTLWDELGKAMEGEDEIEIGEVDCSVSKPVCTKVDIHSYPTFKLFYDGEEVAKYQGDILISLLF